MRRVSSALAATLLFGLAAPAAAQDHSMQGMNMPGMQMPAAPPAKPVSKRKAAPKARSQPQPTKTPSLPTGAAAIPGMAGMDHGAMPGMSMAPGAQTTMPGMQMPSAGRAGGDMQGMSGMAMDGMAQSGTALPAGNAPAPPVPTDYAADRAYSPAEMAAARHHLMTHHGGQDFSQVMFNLAEYQFRKGGDGYRWDGEAWFGGDINRLWLKSEGEGSRRAGLDSAELQLLYGRAIGPYFNLQAGVRQDFKPRGRTYLTVGTEGLASGFFEVNGALFLSTQGELLGRLEGYYDQRITQRLILQPRVELNLAAQDTRETRTGAGVSQAELGLRLRYEIRREFAPYIGVSYERRFGRTADFARAAGEDAYATSFVVGVRTWF